MRESADVVASLPPLLKWAGGKRWLVPRLAGLYEAHRHRRLVEPFCGALSVTLNLQPERALLNDANAHVINFHRWVAKGLRIDLPMRMEAPLYYQHRARFNELVQGGRFRTREAASLFYYLNRTGFNGLCRFNRAGRFNVPYGRYSKINYRRDFAEYRSRLGGWQFRSGDFETLEVAADDFIYADPPYDVSFTQYASGGFGWDGQVRLANWLAAHPGPVVASNAATDRVLGLYRERGFCIRILDAPRRISCNGDRAKAREMLAVKNLHPDGW